MTETEIDQKIIARHHQGASINAIIRELKISRDRVLKALASAGIEATPSAMAVRRMRSEGASVGVIARQRGTRRSAVIKYLPYFTAPRARWTAEEDAIVLSGKTPAGRSVRAARIRRYRLRGKGMESQKIAQNKSVLRSKRLESGLTQMELADLASVSVASIRAYERGILDLHRASIDVLERLGQALGCAYQELLESSKKI